ncbi:MAG: cobalamin-dependent protein [Methanobacteriota archaeon]
MNSPTIIIPPNPETESLVISLNSMDRLKTQEIITRNLMLTDLTSVIEDLVVPALDQIGVMWEKSEVALSQVYMAGVIMEEIIGSLLGKTTDIEGRSSLIAIAVLEDYHMLGERIVSSLLHAAGYSPTRYGRVEKEELIRRVRAEKIQILLISALMLPSALKVKEVSAALKSDTLVKIIVGGAPFRLDEHLWEEVGADSCCNSASDAIRAVRMFMQESQA